VTVLPPTPFVPIDRRGLYQLADAVLRPREHRADLRAAACDDSKFAGTADQMYRLSKARPDNAFALQRDEAAREVINGDLIGIAYWSEGSL